MALRDPLPTPFLLLREHRGEPFYEAKFRYGGQQIKRRIGRAWLTQDGAAGWVPRRGRVADGYLETRVTDRGRWRGPDVTETERGQGLSVAVQFAERLRVTHPPQGAGEPPGARGTVVTTRHRLHRQPMLGPQAVGPSAVPPLSAPFAVELVTAGPGPRVLVSGPVDFSTAERLDGRLLIACRAGVLPLTVDLSQVTILTIAGIRVLYRMAAQLAAHGLDLTLVAGPGSPAAAALDLARLPRTPR